LFSWTKLFLFDIIHSDNSRIFTTLYSSYMYLFHYSFSSIIMTLFNYSGLEWVYFSKNGSYFVQLKYSRFHSIIKFTQLKTFRINIVMTK